MFMALGLDTEKYWKERISVFVATAPVIMPNLKSKLFQASSKISNHAEGVLSKLGLIELFGHDWSKVKATIQTVIPGLTDSVISQFSLKEFADPYYARVFQGHFPHGSSVRQIAHYG